MPRSQKNACTKEDCKSHHPRRVWAGTETELGNEKDDNEREETESNGDNERETKQTKPKGEQQDALAEQELHFDTMLNRAREGPTEFAKDNEAMATAQERINQLKSETEQAQNITSDPKQQEQTQGNGTQPRAQMTNTGGKPCHLVNMNRDMKM